MRCTLALIMLALCLAGCNRKAGQKPPASRNAPLKPNTGGAGDLKTYRGYLELGPLACHGKRARSKIVHTDDGKRIGIGFYNTTRYLGFAGRRVVVRGRNTWTRFSGPQQAHYFKVHAIELAPGERPAKQLDGQVPAPPLVTSGEALKTLKGDWAIATGSAEFETKPVKGGKVFALKRVTITLKDGTRLNHRLYLHPPLSQRSHYGKGARASLLISRAGVSIRTYRYCRGINRRCGVEALRSCEK